MLLIVCLLSIAQIVINTLGQGLRISDSTNILSATTIGDILNPVVNETDIPIVMNPDLLKQNPVLEARVRQVRNYFYVQLSIDMLISLSIFIGYFVLKFKLKGEIAECQKRNISVKKYTILIRNKEIKRIAREDVSKFFERFG